MRKDLSAKGMYMALKERSLKIPDSRLQRPQTISLSDNINYVCNRYVCFKISLRDSILIYS